ncbi:MAG: SPASM domain-containing protein [Acidimicrobiales bacterium]|nr:SPASM domain-containing protein [Acidimicrobiales bacterium]
MSPVACHAPFVSMEFDPAGHVYTCCANQQYPMGRVGESSLAEIWGGSRAQALRAALAVGDLTLGCNSCRWAEDHGNDATVARLYDAYPIPDATPAPPTRMTFALSNRCNLECVMCNGELSSRIRVREGRPPLPAVYGDAFFAELDDFLPSLVQASFLGGEPFLAAENFRIWDRLVERGLQPRCAAVTNATRFDAKVEAVLRHLPFDITVSMDGTTASTVEAIRRNLDFDEAMAHAARFREYTAGAGTAFGFNFCLTVHNWHELGDFLVLADGWDADVRVISVSEPGHCLHDLDEAGLAEVLAGLEAEDEQRRSTLGRNRHCWEVEVEQVRRVLGERGRGVPVTLRQPVAVDGPVIVASGGAVRVGAADRAGALARRFAAGGPVLRLDLAPDATVLAAATERAGVDGAPLVDEATVEGSPADEVLGSAGLGRGRPLYALDRRDEDGVVDQTLLATDDPPARGASGAVLRVVTAATDGGTVAFVAADRFYEREQPVSVAPVGTRGG